MSDQSLLEAPFALASLPKPYDATNGRSFAAPVYGLRGQRWRKRSEIAVTVDGDGISIYNVCLVCPREEDTVGAREKEKRVQRRWRDMDTHTYTWLTTVQGPQPSSDHIICPSTAGSCPLRAMLGAL